ncbi:nucleotidyltransferase family protein [Streptomyces sp. NPDC093510]|uniref:nucleotidyltransferase family protein n=1 Tax=Streptomyces sp. NPDC093510 TaxID=3155199 RepID=UPI00341916DF
MLSFGLLQPKYGTRQMLEALADVGTRDAADLLFRHKISTMARDTALRLAKEAEPRDAELLTELAERVGERASVMADRWRSAPAVGALVTRFAQEEGVRWWTMKGFSFRPLYPEGCHRDVGDLDVLVATMDDAWKLARRLRADGYIYLDIELPWFKRDVRTGELYGQIRLTTPNRDRLSIDIHAGPYSVRHCAVMPLRRTFEGGGTVAGPLAFEDDMCAVVANAAGDCFVTAKMVNDLLLCLDREIDVAYLHDTLDHAGLLPFLATCLGRVADWCEVTGAQAGRIAGLMPDVAPEPVPPVTAADPDGRCEVTVGHARAVTARLFPEEPARVAAVTASARDAYGKDHPLRLVPDAEARPVEWDELNNWTCVRLVPGHLAVAELSGDAPRAGAVPAEGRALSAEVTVSKADGGDLVHAIGDTFVPTVDFALPVGLVTSLAGS